MKVSLLGGSFDTDNMGVSALTSGSIQCVLAQYPHAEISILDYGREGKLISFTYQGQTIPVRFVNMRFSKSFWLPNNIARLFLEAAIARLIPFSSLRRAWIARNPWLQHIQECDLAAAISGGDSFSDIYGLPRLFYGCLPQLLVLVMQRPLVLLPQTIGPFHSAIARLVARTIVRGARRVFSRDYISGEELKKMLAPREISEKSAFSFDVGFILEPIAPPKIEVAGLSLDQPRTAPLVGLNVSGLLYRENNPFGLCADYRQFIPNLVKLLIEEKRASVLLVPHVFGSDPSSEADPPACEQVYNALQAQYPGRLGIVRGRYNQHEIKHVIGRTDFFVGARMHACIAALSQAVPAVCIAYSKKFSGVMETLGIESIVADARALDGSRLLQVVERRYDNREQIQVELRRKMPGVKQSVLSLFEGIETPAGTTSGPLPVVASCSPPPSGS